MIVLVHFLSKAVIDYLTEYECLFPEIIKNIINTNGNNLKIEFMPLFFAARKFFKAMSIGDEYICMLECD